MNSAFLVEGGGYQNWEETSNHNSLECVLAAGFAIHRKGVCVVQILQLMDESTKAHP